MANDTSSEASPIQPPLFLEVFCEVSGKDYRFATGTNAKFAASVINRKLGSLNPRVVFIEAAKEGEEPISFGDDACLVNYGHGWKLKTVIDTALPDAGTEKNDLPQQSPYVVLKSSKDPKSTDSKSEMEGDQSLKYMGRIFIAFVVMFVLGGFFTVALENLPLLISLFNNSSM